MSEQLIKDLRKEIDSKKVVVVVGAGVSISSTKGAQVASWEGLLRDGVRYCVELTGADEQWKQIRTIQVESKKTNELISAAEEITNQLGGREGGAYASWLEQSVGALQIEDGALLEEISNLEMPIITTNYDSLLEQATDLPYIRWEDPRKLDDFIRDKLHNQQKWSVEQILNGKFGR
jgi:hypothetical protein